MMEKKKNHSVLRVLFDRPTVLIEKEELAYPFITLLADFGGVLGLFIGFNFLMIWDIIVSVIEKINKLLCYACIFKSIFMCHVWPSLCPLLRSLKGALVSRNVSFF